MSTHSHGLSTSFPAYLRVFCWWVQRSTRHLPADVRLVCGVFPGKLTRSETIEADRHLVSRPLAIHSCCDVRCPTWITSVFGQLADDWQTTPAIASFQHVGPQVPHGLCSPQTCSPCAQTPSRTSSQPFIFTCLDTSSSSSPRCNEQWSQKSRRLRVIRWQRQEYVVNIPDSLEPVLFEGHRRPPAGLARRRQRHE